MQTKHTPGPWQTAHDDSAIVATGGAMRRAVARVYFTKTAQGDDLEEARANARLIAEAPAMKQTIINLLKMTEDGDITTVELEEARALLARIDGTPS